MKIELGDALRGEEDEAPPSTAAPGSPEPLPSAPDADPADDAAHLCPRCAHATVCGIASAILFAGGEGRVTVSKCGEFVALEDLAATLARVEADRRAASESTALDK